MYFAIIQTTKMNHGLPYKPRWINKLYAKLFGFFWLECDKCGTEYGGHEAYDGENNRCVCPECSVKKHNEGTGIMPINVYKFN